MSYSYNKEGQRKENVIKEIKRKLKYIYSAVFIGKKSVYNWMCAVQAHVDQG